MYLYIYDNFVSGKKYEKIIAQIETRITDLGLNGRIIRLGPNHNIANMLAGELTQNIKAVVLVGDDQLVYKSVNMLSGSKIPLSIIPIGEENNYIAECVGIKPGLEACDVLVSRRIEEMDLGLANNIKFIYGVELAAKNSVLEINNDYTIETKEEGMIKVINMATKADNFPSEFGISPVDRRLDLLVKTSQVSGRIIKRSIDEKISLIGFDSLVINSPRPVTVDGVYELSSPVTVRMAEEKISLIVGKDRDF